MKTNNVKYIVLIFIAVIIYNNILIYFYNYYIIIIYYYFNNTYSLNHLLDLHLSRINQPIMTLHYIMCTVVV